MSDKMWICPQCGYPTIQIAVKVWADLEKGDPNGFVHPTVLQRVIPSDEFGTDFKANSDYLKETLEEQRGTEARCSHCNWKGTVGDTTVDYTVVRMGIARKNEFWEECECFIPAGEDPVKYVMEHVSMELDYKGIFVVRREAGD